MPLSLLAKKSWNVTNPANIARVRRDEALAKAREEEEDRRLKLSESERNMLELRRGMMANMADANGVPMLEKFDAEIRGDKDKKRKRARKDGEEDEWEQARSGTAVIDVGLTGRDGHFNLFADLETGDVRDTNNPTKSYAKKVQEITAPQGDALNQSNTEKRPWYASMDKVGEKALQRTEEQIAKKERVEDRIIARDDPMAEVKKSLAIMKDLEEERRREREEREGLLDDVEVEERRRKRDRDRHRHRKRRRDDYDDHEGRKRRRETHRSRSRSPRDDEKRKERARERDGDRDRERERKHRHNHQRHRREEDTDNDKDDKYRDDKHRPSSRKHHHRHRDDKESEERHRSRHKHDREDKASKESRKEEVEDLRHPSRRYRDMDEIPTERRRNALGKDSRPFKYDNRDEPADQHHDANSSYTKGRDVTDRRGGQY